MAQASTQRQITSLQDSLESIDDREATLSSTDRLARLWSDVKSLEDAAETLRKEVIEPELESRMSPGERVNGVNLIQSHRKYVDESVGSVIARAIGQGINYTEFVSLNASAIADDYPNLTTIGRNEYTYFR